MAASRRSMAFSGPDIATPEVGAALLNWVTVGRGGGDFGGLLCSRAAPRWTGGISQSRRGRPPAGLITRRHEYLADVSAELGQGWPQQGIDS